MTPHTRSTSVRGSTLGHRRDDVAERARVHRLPGYPADARLLIVNADDFGMCHSVNEAVLRAWRDGIVSSVR